MAPAHPCIECAKGVRSNSLAVNCDGCSRWCHIQCGTGITREQYVQLRSENEQFSWTCNPCAHEAVQRQATPVPMDIDDFPLDFARSPPQTPPTPVPRIMNDFPDMSFIAEDFLAPPRPHDFPESFIEDPTPVDVHVDEPHVVTYKIVKETSIRGRDILYDSVGYSYTVKRCNTNKRASLKLCRNLYLVLV